jgi:hypothetical protein
MKATLHDCSTGQLSPVERPSPHRMPFLGPPGTQQPILSTSNGHASPPLSSAPTIDASTMKLRIEEVSSLSRINHAATTQQSKLLSRSSSPLLPMLAPLSCSVPRCEYYTPEKTAEFNAKMQVLMLYMVGDHKMETRDPAHYWSPRSVDRHASHLHPRHPLVRVLQGRFKSSQEKEEMRSLRVHLGLWDYGILQKTLQ